MGGEVGGASVPTTELHTHTYAPSAHTVMHFTCMSVHMHFTCMSALNNIAIPYN